MINYNEKKGFICDMDVVIYRLQLEIQSGCDNCCKRNKKKSEKDAA